MPGGVPTGAPVAVVGLAAGAGGTAKLVALTQIDVKPTERNLPIEVFMIVSLKKQGRNATDIVAWYTPCPSWNTSGSSRLSERVVRPLIPMLRKPIPRRQPINPLFAAGRFLPDSIQDGDRRQRPTDICAFRDYRSVPAVIMVMLPFTKYSLTAKEQAMTHLQTRRKAHAGAKPASKRTNQAKNASKSVAREDIDDGLPSDSTETATQDTLKPLPKSGSDANRHSEESLSTDDDIGDLGPEQREQALRERTSGL
jgi:hypothetical protein